MTSFVNSGGVDSGMDLLVILLGRNVSATFMLLKTWGGGREWRLYSSSSEKREKRSNVPSEEPKDNRNGAFQKWDNPTKTNLSFFFPPTFSNTPFASVSIKRGNTAESLWVPTALSLIHPRCHLPFCIWHIFSLSLPQWSPSSVHLHLSHSGCHLHPPPSSAPFLAVWSQTTRITDMLLTLKNNDITELVQSVSVSRLEIKTFLPTTKIQQISHFNNMNKC